MAISSRVMLDRVSQEPKMKLVNVRMTRIIALSEEVRWTSLCWHTQALSYVFMAPSARMGLVIQHSASLSCQHLIFQGRSGFLVGVNLISQALPQISNYFMYHAKMM